MSTRRTVRRTQTDRPDGQLPNLSSIRPVGATHVEHIFYTTTSTNLEEWYNDITRALQSYIDRPRSGSVDVIHDGEEILRIAVDNAIACGFYFQLFASDSSGLVELTGKLPIDNAFTKREIINSLEKYITDKVDSDLTKTWFRYIRP